MRHFLRMKCMKIVSDIFLQNYGLLEQELDVVLSYFYLSAFVLPYLSRFSNKTQAELKLILRKEKCSTIFLLFLPSGHLSEFRNCVFVLRCKLKDFYLSTMSDARKRESWQILMEGDAQTRFNTVIHSFRKNWSYVNFLTFYQTYIVATIFLVNWYRVIENL